MSTPNPPGQPGGWIPVGAAAPPVAPPAAGRRSRPVLVVLGVAVLLVGIGAAIALVVAGSKRLDDGVQKLARGPANCATTLDVATDATYYFYVETRGQVDDVRGTCPAVGDGFEADDGGSIRISLQDADGESVRLRRADGVSYDSGGYRGALERTAELDAGRYQLTVEADDDIVVAVGRDVDGLKPKLFVPVVVGVAGLLLGLAFILLGRRGGTPAAPAGGAPAFAAAGGGPGPFAGTGLAAPGQPVPGQPPAGPQGGWGAPPPPARP